MAKNNTVQDALIKRINRKLIARGEKMIVTKKNLRGSLGLFHLVSTLTGMTRELFKTPADLKEFATKVGVTQLNHLMLELPGVGPLPVADHGDTIAKALRG